MEVACDRADDDDDPPCATSADGVCNVETLGETGTVVGSANLTFFMLGSASDTGHDILSCASLTRALRATSETLFRVVTRRPQGSLLHCSQNIQECTRIGSARLKFGCTLDAVGMTPC